MLEALVEVQERIDKLEFEDMLEFLAKRITEILKTERCSIFRVFRDSETLYLMTGEPKDEHGLGMTFSFANLESLKEAVEKESQVYVPDARQDKRTQESRGVIFDKEINSLLITPLIAGDEVSGLIVVDASRSKKNFTEEEKCFCLILGNLVSLLLERDLVHREREEKKTLTILGQVAAEAAHRMRNPLVPIGGFAKRLAKEIQEPKYKEYAEIIVRETERLESILEGLLRFSKPKKAKVVLTDINEIIRQAEKIIVDGLIKEKQIRTELKLNPEIPFLLVDPLEIRDVFLDILRNATEAIEKEGMISIQSKKECNHVKISFANNGGCIDEEIIEHITDPFFTTKPGSTGLGLASVVRILDAYGGELKVANDLQARQTTFIIKLPYSQEDKIS